MKNSFKFLGLVAILLMSSTLVHAQDDVDNNRLKIEFEPGLFFNNGRSVNVLYNVTKDNNLGIGAYLMTTDIPDDIAKNMFVNFNDSMNCRVTQEYALNLRYRFKLAKNMESNPYVGLIVGWENIRIQKAGYNDLNIETFLLTPFIGYEFYVYKKMFYLNPQLRSAFYLGAKNLDDTRPEKLKSFLIVPSISVGLRI